MGVSTPETTHQRYSNEVIGEMAERAVETLAMAGHMNKCLPFPDRDGWDFHFSMPRSTPLDGSNFFDSDPPIVSAFAQVKGTVARDRRRAVALAHWRHAATMTMPFFFIIVEFDTPPTPARLFVVHVDSMQVERVMERLRKEGAKAKTSPPKLHEKTMDVTWDESHSVACNGMAFRAALLGHTGDDMRAYADDKRKWSEEAGATTVRHEISMHLKGERAHNNQRLADWALGLTDTLHVDEFSRVEHRWGIPRKHVPEKDVKVSFGAPPSIGRTLVRISDRHESEHAEFEADVYCNVCFVPYLPKETWAIRLVGGFLQLIFRKEARAGRVDLRLPPTPGALKLADLATTARAFRLLAGPSVITYQIPKYGGGLQQTEMNPSADAQLAGGALGGTTMLAAAEAAWSICNFFGASPQLAIDPDELEENAKELVQWARMISSTNVNLQLDVPDPHGLEQGESAAGVSFSALTLGTSQLITALVTESPVEIIDGWARIEGRPRFARKWVVPVESRDEWRREKFIPLVRELKHEIEGTGRTCVFHDDGLADEVAGVPPTLAQSSE